MLTKFCETKHHPRSWPTLKLGSLSYYQTIEQEYLRDEGEGLYELNVTVKNPSRLSRDVAAAISGKGIGTGGRTPLLPGQHFTKSAIINMRSNSDGTVNMWDSEFDTTFRFPDSLVFCMSIDDLPAKFVKEYDDHWSIDKKHAERLQKAIIDALCEMPACRVLETDVELKIDSLGLTLECRGDRMVYRKRSHTVDAAMFNTVEEIKEFYFQIPFIKPPTFVDESEFRFLFSFKQGANYLSCRKEVFVNIADFYEEVGLSSL
jgi:hypothetical protein